MKNLKKIAALVIVLAMALSTVSFAAYTDVAVDASYNEAVTVMSALGLLKGYEDGSFGPDKTITRAEFAAVVVRMLGMEDAAAGAATATNFTDVPASHWAAGYVKIANQKEIILGYGDGTFGPDDEVTYEQAIKMLVCALGYAPMFADVKDAYPTSYMAQANTLGMTVGANGKIGDKATRAIVARLAYNALDDKLMEQTGFGTDKEFKQVNKTLLSDYLKVVKVNANVDPVGFDAEDADKVAISNPELLGVEYVNSYGTQSFAASTYDAVEGLDIPRGYAVTAFVDFSDDDEVVLAVVPRAGKNESVTITAKQFVNIDSSKLEYYVVSEEDGKTDEFKLDTNGVKVYRNNDIYTTTATTNLTTAIAGGSVLDITLISNNATSGYDVIVYTDYESDVVDDIYDNSYRVDSYTMDPEDENNTFDIVNEKGEKIDFADIKVNDVINAIVSYDGTTFKGGNKYTKFIVTSNKVEGAISELSGSKVYINGTEYTDATGLLKAGDKGTFYVDIADKILDKDLDASSRTFGILYAIYNDTNGADNETKATIYTKDGKFETYGFAKNVGFNSTTTVAMSDLELDSLTAPTKIQKKADSSPVYAIAQGIVMYSVNSSNDINQLVNFATIDSIATEYSDFTSTTAKFDSDDDTIGGNAIVDSTVVIANKKSAFGSNVKDDFSISSKAIFTDDNTTTYSIQGLVDENDEIVIMAAHNATPKASNTDPVMIISKSQGTGTTEDGDSYTTIRGFVNGVQKSINVIVNDPTNIYHADGTTPVGLSALTPGSIIQYSEGDIVPAIKVIATAAQVVAAAENDPSKTKLTLGTTDYKDDVKGYLYSGTLYSYNNGIAYFDPTDTDSDSVVDTGAVKVKFSAAAPTVKVTLTKDTATPANYNGVKGVYANNYSIADADTFRNFGSAADTAIVYLFDGEALACIVIDENENINR